MIKLEKINYKNKEKNLFNELDLCIAKGSYVSITGPNGSGKTSLAMLIKGFFTPTSGRVFYEGEDVTGKGLNARIAYVFSNPENQIVSSLVSEDVAFGPENQGKTGHELERLVRRALSGSDLGSLSSALTHQLSGGQQQRVAIAGILAMKVDCIIFDEAVSMVDPSAKMELLKLLYRLSSKEGIAVIHISHNLEDILKTERVIALKEGTIVFDGSPCDILGNAHMMDMLGWGGKGLASFINKLIDKGLLFQELGYFPDGVATSLARHCMTES